MLAAVADGPTYSSTCQSAPRRTLAIVKLTKRGAEGQPQPPKALCNPDTTPARSKRTRERGPPQGEVTPTAPPHTPPGDGRAKGSALRANRRVLQGPFLTPCRPSGNVHGASSNGCYRRRRKMERW